MTYQQIPRHIKILVLFTIANLLILGIRNYIVGDSFFNFLKSNLLSGVMPFVIAVGISVFNKKTKRILFYCF